MAPAVPHLGMAGAELEKPAFPMSSETIRSGRPERIGDSAGTLSLIQAEMALRRRRARSAVPEMPRRSIDVGSGTAETSA